MKNIKAYLIIFSIIVLIFSSLFFVSYQETKSRENLNIAIEHRKEIFKDIREKEKKIKKINKILMKKNKKKSESFCLNY